MKQLNVFHRELYIEVNVTVFKWNSQNSSAIYLLKQTKTSWLKSKFSTQLISPPIPTHKLHNLRFRLSGNHSSSCNNHTLQYILVYLIAHISTSYLSFFSFPTQFLPPQLFKLCSVNSRSMKQNEYNCLTKELNY